LSDDTTQVLIGPLAFSVSAWVEELASIPAWRNFLGVDRPEAGRRKPEIPFAISRCTEDDCERGGTTRLQVSSKHDTIKASLLDTNALFDLKVPSASAKLSREPHLPMLLRLFSAYLLPKRGAFLAHAAAIVLRGGIYLFLGPSGAGKSTLAERAARDGLEVLSDENVILGAGPRGEPFAWGTPFAGTGGQASNLSGLLHGLFFLRRGRAPSALEPLAPSLVILKLLKNLLLLTEGLDPVLVKELLDGVLDVATRLAKTVPAYLFTWELTKDPWSLLP
jgi:hypothetical protein